MDKDYTIIKAERREKWFSKQFNKEYQAYAVQLEGVEGWVELSQLLDTPAPAPGATLHGHTYATTVGENTYLKFKKVNPNFQNGPAAPQATTPGALVGADKTLDYAVEMLEELTGRRPKKAEAKKEDVVIEDLDDEINLADIPF